MHESQSAATTLPATKRKRMHHALQTRKQLLVRCIGRIHHMQVCVLLCAASFLKRGLAGLCASKSDGKGGAQRAVQFTPLSPHKK